MFLLMDQKKIYKHAERTLDLEGGGHSAFKTLFIQSAEEQRKTMVSCGFFL
jgi:hypothetical protein